MLDFLNDYILLVVLGICLCVGYMLKNACPKFPNNYIPAAMGGLGVLLSIWINQGLTPEGLLAGLVSGLASTGLYESLNRLIFKDGDK